jgi:hypothetical protein
MQARARAGGHQPDGKDAGAGRTGGGRRQEVPPGRRADDPEDGCAWGWGGGGARGRQVMESVGARGRSEAAWGAAAAHPRRPWHQS